MKLKEEGGKPEAVRGKSKVYVETKRDTLSELLLMRQKVISRQTDQFQAL